MELESFRVAVWGVGEIISVAIPANGLIGIAAGTGLNLLHSIP